MSKEVHPALSFEGALRRAPPSLPAVAPGARPTVGEVGMRRLLIPFGSVTLPKVQPGSKTRVRG